MSTFIYQIQYSDDVLGEFDSAFTKYDCRDNPEPQKREIAHMIRFYDEKAWNTKGDENFGLVSPKFSSKAKISGRAFIDWVDANPGYDVYFINPFPQLVYWNFNVWTQGEYWHPGLTELANELFSAADIDINIVKLPRNTASSLLYSNYWCGNEKFWHRYMAFIKKLVFSIDNLPDEKKINLYELAPHYAPATYFPFIFERLFSTFLLLECDINSLPYPYSQEEIQSRCSNNLELFIVKEWGRMIEKWDETGRCDSRYRKIFENLQGMISLYQSAALTSKGLTNKD